MGSGLAHVFGVVRLHRTTYSQGKEGVYATDTPVPGGSTAANLLAPGRTLQCRENNVRRGLAPEFEVVRLDRTTFSQGEEGVYGT